VRPLLKIYKKKTLSTTCKKRDTKLSACVWQCEKQQTEFDTKYGITTKCKRKQESRALRPGGSPAAELGGIHPFVLGCWKSW
jgi:Fe-S-cluster-containing hydrogenase component 2